MTPDHPHRPPHRPVRHVRAVRAAIAALVAVVVLASTGCGVRLETPPPAEPSPDAAEQVRARTVGDALALAGAALSARATLADDDPSAAVLDDVAAFSTAHADEFGGVYDSGLPEPSPSGAPGPVGPATTPPSPVSSPADVLAALRATTAVALTDADAYPDGPTARLLAAVGAARGELAARLTDALGAPPEESASPSPADGPEGATASPGPVPLPEGLTADDVAALVLAHDQAGYALEVVAAKLADAPRATALEAARRHRAAAQEWLDRAASGAAAPDPRLPVYALPAGLDETTAGPLAADLETAVAVAASAAIAHTAPGARGELVDLMRASLAAARSWGAAATAFPAVAAG